MIKNIVFDFGGVLIDWNPLHLYNGYFGDEAKAKWFIENICTMDWNVTMDAGKPFDVGVAELTAIYPEWADAIAAYRDRWHEMIGGSIPGMTDIIRGLKNAGYHVFGLSNWSWETLSTIIDDFPAVQLLEGKVISGQEFVIKPDPKIYQILLDRYHLDADECLFVDDNIANIHGAEAVGIHGLQFFNPTQFVNDLAKLNIHPKQE